MAGINPFHLKKIYQLKQFGATGLLPIREDFK